MDSYINFTKEKIKLGTISANSISQSILREIILSVDSGDGGAEVSFYRLTDEVFNKLTSCFDNPVYFKEDSYIVDINDEIKIYYTSSISKLYALYAIKRHYTPDGVKKGIIYNVPKLEMRGFRAYLPGKRKLDEFKKLIDFLISFGYNTLMLEIGGAMEYKRHPEINEGWLKYCEIVEEFNGKPFYAKRIWDFPKNAVHSANGEEDFLTQEELSLIVDYCRERDVEIIPEVPTFCHVDYLLFNHRELAECPDEPIPNNACPSNEDYYRLVFDILDEVIEVFNPKRINICHDEAYVYGQCPKCRTKSGAELFGGHIVRLHDYLATKNVKTMLWGDGIIKTFHGGNAAYHQELPWDGKRIATIEGKTYKVRDYLCLSVQEWEKVKAEQPDARAWYVEEKYGSMDIIPKDIQAINWSWGFGEYTDAQYIENGMYQVYGNYRAVAMKNFDERINKGVSGYLYSHWARNDFDTLQRTGSLFHVAYNSLATWSHSYSEDKKYDNIKSVSEAVYKFMNYDILMRKHLEITHATNDLIKHTTFLVHKIIREDYRMGFYEVTYIDDTTDLIPIYWGLNIGQLSPGFEKFELSDEEGGYFNIYSFEPVGTAKFVYDGGDVYYTIAVPVEKDVKSVKPVMTSDYNVELKSAVVVGK